MSADQLQQSVVGTQCLRIKPVACGINKLQQQTYKTSQIYDLRARNNDMYHPMSKQTTAAAHQPGVLMK